MKPIKIPVQLLVAAGVMLLIILILILKIIIGPKGIFGNGHHGEDILPVLTLELDESNLENGSVTILVTATIDDKKGISSIELPDGEQVDGDTAEYEVTENGKYEFKAFGVNGNKSRGSIEVKGIQQVAKKEPYLPEGFKHIAGEIDTGYVIQDKYGNEYVWVPVERGILKRTTLMDGNYEDSSSTATGLVNSAAKNLGFYIGRYEASAFQADGVKFA